MKHIVYLFTLNLLLSLSSMTLAENFSEEASIKSLVRNLKSADKKKKAHAILGLAYLKHTESIEQFRKLLKAKHPGIAKAAVNALAIMSDTESVSDMYKLFMKSKKHKIIQKAILNAFATVNDEKTIPFILKMLPMLDPSTAQVAFDTLKKIQEPPVFESDSGRDSLESFSISGYIGQGKNTKVKVGKQFFGISDSILGYKITAINVDEGIVSLEKDNEIFSKEIDTGKQNDLEKSIENLNSSDDKVVYKALLNITYHRSPQASEELLSLAKGNNNSNINLAAIYALGQCEVSESHDFLKKVLDKSKSSDEIIIAAESLSLIGNENSLDSLDSLVQHRNPWVRNAIISAIGYLESPNSLSTLVRGLNDKFSFVRQNAYNQLMNLVSGETVGTLASILQGDRNNLNDEKNKLIQYIANIPSTSNMSNPFAETKTKVVVAPPKKKTWKPSFQIVSFGQFQSKSIVTVIYKGVRLNLGEGESVEGKKIVSIDADDESMIIINGDKELTLIMGEGEGAPAEVLE